MSYRYFEYRTIFHQLEHLHSKQTLCGIPSDGNSVIVIESQAAEALITMEPQDVCEDCERVRQHDESTKRES